MPEKIRKDNGQIIGVCGFSWSGSGAVIDYLMEFEECQVLPPEFIIAYHPDGLHDLDVNLNENCAKFLSSGVAIPRFRRVAGSLLSSITNGEEKRLTNKYLDQIVQCKWIGLEQGQELLRNRWLYKKIGLRIRNSVITRLSPQFCWKHKPYPLAEMEFSICPENFDSVTRDYIDDLLEQIGLNLSKKIVLNQPFPGNNPIPYMKYFNNSKAIVVDRDPRDVFTFLKYVFPGHSYSVPLENVDVFCDYFLNMHKNLEATISHPDLLYMHFEDLVYNYEETAQTIRDFLDLKEPSLNKKYFIPEESEANTQVFHRYGDKKETETIERKLKEYLYDFSKVKKQTDNDQMFDDNPKSIDYSFIKK